MTSRNAYKFDDDHDDDDDAFSRIYHEDESRRNITSSGMDDDIASISMFTANNEDDDYDDTLNQDDYEDFTYTASDDVIEIENKRRLEAASYNGNEIKKDSTLTNDEKESSKQRPTLYVNDNKERGGDGYIGISQVFQPVTIQQSSSSGEAVTMDENPHRLSTPPSSPPSSRRTVGTADGDGLTVYLDDIDNDIDDMNTLVNDENTVNDGATSERSLGQFLDKIDTDIDDMNTLINDGNTVNDGASSGRFSGQKPFTEQEMKNRIDQQQNQTQTIEGAGGQSTSGSAKHVSRQASSSSNNTTPSQKAAKIETQFAKRCARHEQLIPKAYRNAKTKGSKQRGDAPVGAGPPEHDPNHNGQGFSNNGMHHNDQQQNAGNDPGWRPMDPSIKNLITMANDDFAQQKEEEKQKKKKKGLFSYKKKKKKKGNTDRLPSIDENSATSGSNKSGSNASKTTSSGSKSHSTSSKSRATPTVTGKSFWADMWEVLMASPMFLKVILITSLILMTMSFSFLGVMVLSRFIKERADDIRTSLRGAKSIGNGSKGGDAASVPIDDNASNSVSPDQPSVSLASSFDPFPPDPYL